MLCVATTYIHAQHEHHNHEAHMQPNLWTNNRADGHAPISVMGDHIHHKGGVMISYRYMTMDMRELREGTNDKTNADAHAKYMVAPQDMVMNMHMLGAMYAPSNTLTFMVMANYLEQSMNLQMRDGNQFSTRTDGFGDLSINTLYRIFNKNQKAMHGQLGLSLPTGSIEEKAVLPMSMGNALQLPYPMQTGTGSFGVNLGLTYLGQNNKLSWGHQLMAALSLNENDQDYRFGNRYSLNHWLSARAGNNLSVSIRIEGLFIDEIHGSSPLLNPMMVSTADSSNSGATIVNSGFGLNYMITNGHLRDFRVSAEISTPLYQDLNGIQLKQNYNITFGVQQAFH